MIDSAGIAVEAAIISPGETYLKLISSLNDGGWSPIALVGAELWVNVVVTVATHKR